MTDEAVCGGLRVRGAPDCWPSWSDEFLRGWESRITGHGRVLRGWLISEKTM